MNVDLDRIALELGRATVGRIAAEQRAEAAEEALQRANARIAALEEVAKSTAPTTLE